MIILFVPISTEEMNKKAECIRNVTNWSAPAQKYVFGSSTFHKNEVETLIAQASPKMDALFKKIQELDAADMKEHGTLFKHMIFTDVKASLYGAKMLAAGFAAKGFNHVYDSKFKLDKIPSGTSNFALLCSSTLYGKPIGVRFRKQLLDIFNQRPNNVHGEVIRFIILDQGFKEGIDLFDIKYVHLFEPLITAADEKQAIGRGTRLCGQAGLQFDSELGWPLHVIRYEMSIPDELQYAYESSRLFELFLKYSGIDIKKFVFANTLESMCVFGAVDHDLTKNVHDFNISKPTKSSRGMRSIIVGGAKKRDLKKRVAPPRKKKDFWGMREYISERFGKKYTWEKAELENKCVDYGGAEFVEFNETQNFTRMYFQPSSAYKGLMLWHSTGTGKCHAANTPILMYDGTIKMVQDVMVGDLLMGDDSTPRRVLSLAEGSDEMYTISNQDRDVEYTVNSEHILCLRENHGSVVHEITVKDWLSLSPERRLRLKGYRVPIDFPSQYSEIDPYTFGYLLNEHDSYIPSVYKINDRYVRLQFLAGLIDASKGLNIRVKNIHIIPDILYICRSLGFAAYAKGDVVELVGNDGLDEIPIRFPMKMEYTYGALQYDISVTPRGVGKYYGFTLDGNCRYVLGDFTVTHNTCSAVAISSTSWERHGYNVIWVTRHTLKPDIWKNLYKQVCSVIIKEQIKRGEIPDDAYKKPLRYLSKRWLPPLSYKQFSNMLAGKNEYYKEMVRRNGKEDILKNTLVIIDEAHKLFAVDVPSTERPNVDMIYKSILDSYDKSGADSARVLLMTATPYTSDPMHLIKLINLMKPRKEHIPEDFDSFAKKYLDVKGEFTEQGKEAFLNDITGCISYLNREKDARQFAYPVFENVIVPMSISKKRQKEAEFAAITQQLQDLTKKVDEGNAAVKASKQKIREEVTQLNARCAKLPMKERKACKDNVATKAAQFEKDLLEELQQKIVVDKGRISDMKDRAKSIKTELKDLKVDISTQDALEEKCGIFKKSA